MVFVVLLRILAVVLLMTFLVVFGGRLLGVRQSWFRALVASGLGLLIGAPLALAVAPQTPGPYALFLIFAILLPTLLASMAVSVGLDLMARPDPVVRVQDRLATVPHPLRSFQRWAARERRYRHITWLAARHGLVPWLLGGRRGKTEAEPPVETPHMIHNLRLALEEAGGVFVKLGQVLSTRSDLLSEAMLTELASLQDAVAPAPRTEIEPLLRAELGADPTRLFAEFSWEPVAAASIAQVYRGRLVSGEEVAVKVQRPDIKTLMEGDLDILLRLSRIIESNTSWGREFGILDLMQGFAVSLREELDFRVEARNIITVLKGIGATKTKTVRIPQVYTHLSTERVLVTEWFDGASLRESAPLLNQLGLDPHALARDLLDAVLGQVMREGTFHADPHPGNVVVLTSGQIGLLDFGSVGRIDMLQQAALRSVLTAIQRRDAAELRIALLALAVEVPAETNDDLLERALGHFMARHLGPELELSPSAFSEMFRLLLQFGVAFPPEIGAVFRAVVTLEGTLRVLIPDFQIMDEARTLGARWMRESFAPSSLRKAVTDEFQALLPLLRRLPRRLDRITEAAERGSFSVNVRLFADPRDARLISTLVSRTIMAVLGASIGLMSVILLGTQTGPELIAPITLFQALGYLGLCASLVLILRVVVALVRDRLV